MPGRWREDADAILRSVDENLPPGADLETRRQACLRAKPWKFHVTSWGRKVWAQAQRAYLEKHGLPPIKPASPLERAKARSER